MKEYLAQMKTAFHRYSLLIWVTFILCAGFATIITFNYYTSHQYLKNNLSENTLPITGDSIYSEIQKDILKPVFVSAQMANDTFVKDWILNGEKDSSLILKYLKEVKETNQAVTSFLISERSKKYYHPTGVLKTIDELQERDSWYLRVRAMKKNYETNVDFDLANKDNLTIFTNYRLLDYKGNFLGAVGVGLPLDGLKKQIDLYQSRFQRKIFFIDTKGRIVLTGSRNQNLNLSITQIEGMHQIAAKILQNKGNDSLHLDYDTQHGRIVLNSRYIPELGWHLLVEQNLNIELAQVRKVFLFNALICLAVTLLVLFLILARIRRYQRKLENIASTDPLTKLINRHAFDFVFTQSILDSERTREPLCVALLDIDFFKKINDQHGHLIGDHVLSEIAMIMKRSLRESDIICRWGGEEFLILLKNCTLEKSASIAETLRATIEANDFSRTTSLAKNKLRITVCIGVAQFQHQESEDSVFERADLALYQAKENGRNSVYFSE